MIKPKAFFLGIILYLCLFLNITDVNIALIYLWASTFHFISFTFCGLLKHTNGLDQDSKNLYTDFLKYCNLSSKISSVFAIIHIVLLGLLMKTPLVAIFVVFSVVYEKYIVDDCIENS